jgi:hypothetical protein
MQLQYFIQVLTKEHELAWSLMNVVARSELAVIYTNFRRRIETN